MTIIRLKQERELLLKLKHEDLRAALRFNVTKPRIGSCLIEPFLSSGSKYNGKVDESSFKLSFPKSLVRPELFFTTIHGSFIEIESGLQVKVKTSVWTWYLKILLFQLLFAVLLILFIFGSQGSGTNFLLMILPTLLAILIPIIGVELYYASKGVKTALEEITNDLLRIETSYNKI